MREYVNIKQNTNFFISLSLFIKRNSACTWIIFFILCAFLTLLLDVKKVSITTTIRNCLERIIYDRSFLYSASQIFVKKSESSTNYIKETQEIEREKLIQENQQLKKLLNFIEDNKISQQKFTTTQIIGNAKGRFLVIRCGKNSGIQKDALVVSDLGLVGKITDVNDSFSKVMLVTNPRFRIPAIGLKSEYRFIVSGDGSKTLKTLLLSGQLEDGEIIFSTIGRWDIPIGKFSTEKRSIIPFNTETKLNNITILSNS